MRVLDLFSGIGGFSLGLERAGMTTVGMCEIDPFCRQVLKRHWPEMWIHDDVRTLTTPLIRERCGHVDLIAGGFPCQDLSAAGKGAGLDGERSGLWWELCGIIARLRPAWVLIENVPALRTRGADRVLSCLEGIGYSVWPIVVGAWAVGAPHKRDRVWIVGKLADAKGSIQRPEPRGARSGKREGEEEARGRILQEGMRRALDGRPTDTGCSELADGARHGQRQQPASERADRQRAGASGNAELADADERGRRIDEPERGGGLADTDRERLALRPEPKNKRRDLWNKGSTASKVGAGSPWPARPGEPQHEWEAPRLLELPLGGTVAGIPVRLVRRRNKLALKAYGNTVVPQVVEAIGRAILEAQR